MEDEFARDSLRESIFIDEEMSEAQDAPTESEMHFRNEFSAEEDLYSLLENAFQGVLVLNGMGSSSQYLEPERLKDPETSEGGKLHRICSSMDRDYGTARIMYDLLTGVTGPIRQVLGSGFSSMVVMHTTQMSPILLLLPNTFRCFCSFASRI